MITPRFPPNRLRLFLGSGLVALALTVAPPPLAAQECWDCQSEESPVWGFIHWDNVQDWVRVKAPDGRHAEWGLGTCYAVHTDCTLLTPEQEQDFIALLQGRITPEDGDRFRSAVQNAALRARVNPERLAIQLLSCDLGQVVAHIPVSALGLADFQVMLAH